MVANTEALPVRNFSRLPLSILVMESIYEQYPIKQSCASLDLFR